MLLYLVPFWHLNVKVALGERLLLWDGVPTSGDTVLFCALQVYAFLERTSLRSRSKISGAHGREGPVCSWLRAMGVLYEEVSRATSSSLTI